MGDSLLARIVALLNEDLRVNNFEAQQIDLGADSDEAQWILEDPDTGFHWTIEVRQI